MAAEGTPPLHNQQYLQGKNLIMQNTNDVETQSKRGREKIPCGGEQCDGLEESDELLILNLYYHTYTLPYLHNIPFI